MQYFFWNNIYFGNMYLLPQSVKVNFYIFYLVLKVLSNYSWKMLELK